MSFASPVLPGSYISYSQVLCPALSALERCAVRTQAALREQASSSSLRSRSRDRCLKLASDNSRDVCCARSEPRGRCPGRAGEAPRRLRARPAIAASVSPPSWQTSRCCWIFIEKIGAISHQRAIMGGRALRALCASASWAARGLVADAAPAAALAGNPFVLESSNSRASMHAEASSRGAAGDPRQSTPPPPRLWPWALSGAAALACASAVIAESPSQGAEGPASRSDRAEGLRAFLSRIGVDLRGLSLGPSPSAGASNDDMGILFTDEARRRVLGSAAWRAASWVLPWTWFGSATLATFPLPATISADSAASDPVFGGAISECMAAGLADERVALAMYLAMHR